MLPRSRHSRTALVVRCRILNEAYEIRSDTSAKPAQQDCTHAALPDTERSIRDPL